jgi:hypothetical protein
VEVFERKGEENWSFFSKKNLKQLRQALGALSLLVVFLQLIYFFRLRFSLQKTHPPPLKATDLTRVGPVGPGPAAPGPGHAGRAHRRRPIRQGLRGAEPRRV